MRPMNSRRTHNNVVPITAGLSIDRPRRDHTADAFGDLTAALVMERHRRGELDPAIVAALLAGVGLGVADGT
jgi:hypothetical protein